MVRTTTRLTDGGPESRRMAQIIAELFPVEWVQTFDSGRINVELQIDECERFVSFIETFGWSVTINHRTHDAYDETWHDMTIER